MRLAVREVRSRSGPPATWPGPEPGVSPEGIIGFMEDLKARLADAEAKLSHVKEYL